MNATNPFLTSFLILILAVGLPAGAATTPPAEGGSLPGIQLAIPEDPVQRSYLGLEGKGSFTIPEIDADVVIVEIFSMY